MTAPLGIVHGYGFSGAGSNLWTRSMCRALCQLGHDVHVVCQESRPEVFDFVAEVYSYDAEGSPQQRLDRETPFPGRCTVHRPELKVLPTYVAPRVESKYVRSILDLDDAAISDYVQRNASVLASVAATYGVSGFCVNHVVLASIAAQQVKAEAGVPFAVLPHGSAIEYVVKKDERMYAAAAAALGDADRVFALNGEMENRLRDVFGDVPDLEQRVERLPVGVDTKQFECALPEDRPRLVDELIGMIADLPRGRTAAQQSELRTRIRDDITPDELRNALSEGTNYTSSAPDADLEARLRNFDWENVLLIAYVGRLTETKGAATPLVAFPDVLARHPSARLVLAGTGDLRETLEALVWALANGQGRLARLLVSGDGGAGNTEPLVHAHGFFERLEREGRWEEYIRRASENLRPEHVLFTGFIDHGPLSRIYALADVGVFPSVVREASPLVVPEAAASGTLPIGTDYGGMGDSLKTLGRSLPADARDLLTIRYHPDHAVPDLIDRLDRALRTPRRWSQDLRQAAVERYDWQTIAGQLAASMEALRR
jgi:glycosyltransferase involved in cell wall biosynthesis